MMDCINSLSDATQDKLGNKEMTPEDFWLSFFPYPYAAIHPPPDCRKLRSVHIQGNIKYYIKQKGLLVKQM
jgi:hypothetical protein